MLVWLNSFCDSVCLCDLNVRTFYSLPFHSHIRVKSSETKVVELKWLWNFWSFHLYLLLFPLNHLKNQLFRLANAIKIFLWRHPVKYFKVNFYVNLLHESTRELFLSKVPLFRFVKQTLIEFSKGFYKYKKHFREKLCSLRLKSINKTSY